MFCTNCGGRVDGNPRYCLNCGAPLRDAANPRSPEPPETAPAAPRRPAALPLKGHPLRRLRAAAVRRQNPAAQPVGAHFLNNDPSLPYPFWNEECDLAGIPRIHESLWENLTMVDGVPTVKLVGYCPCCCGAVSEADRRWSEVWLPGFTAADEIMVLVEYYECPTCHQFPSEEDLLASPNGADPAFECSIERMQRIAIERMKRGSNGEHEPAVHAASESSQASPGFCVVCGTRLEPGLRFCPSCGTLLR